MTDSFHFQHKCQHLSPTVTFALLSARLRGRLPGGLFHALVCAIAQKKAPLPPIVAAVTVSSDCVQTQVFLAVDLTCERPMPGYDHRIQCFAVNSYLLTWRS